MIAEAVLCMALTVYHEARGEPEAGQLAVALVVRNRAEQRGTSICWEVFLPRQFSWTNDDRLRHSIPHGKTWDRSLAIARRVIKGEPDFTGGANHYDRLDHPPKWSIGMTVTGIWGAHVFFKS